MIRWLRRRPTRAELLAEVELWRSRCERNAAQAREAYTRTKAAEKAARIARHETLLQTHETARVRKEADRLIRQIQAEVIAQLNEPPGVEGCRKVRFHRQAEAEEFAREVAMRVQEDPDGWNAYQCKVCPRSPLTLSRYWHAGHGDPVAKETGAAAQRQRAQQSQREGRLLRQQLDPATLTQLLQLRQGNGAGDDSRT